MKVHGYKQAIDEDLGAVYHEWNIEDRLDILAADQDHRDGRALRRLREALPDEAVGFEVGAWVRREDDPQYPGWGFRVDAEWWSPEFRSASGRGSTIAEAADKCREALG